MNLKENPGGFINNGMSKGRKLPMKSELKTLTSTDRVKMGLRSYRRIPLSLNL